MTAVKAIDHHLYSRNSHLYYRISLPRPLHIILPFKEVRIALGTQDRAVARLYVAKMDIEIQSLISQIYTAPDIETARTIIRQGIEGMKGYRKGRALSLISHHRGVH
ncbi:MAG: hypothetical protein KUG56_01360, partial [Kordiimonadaceae bacterium]|nr:hypothetical protein [Kordiimonadaceae bacterium]